MHGSMVAVPRIDPDGSIPVSVGSFQPINMILDDVRVAFMLPRRVASSTIRETVKAVYPRQRIRLVDNAAIAKLSDEFLIVAFVRHPLDRLVSFWRGFVAAGSVSPIWEAHGVKSGMPFDAFARTVCGEWDSDADVHWMSQARLLSCHIGHLLPDWIGRHETLAESWAEIAPQLNQRGLAVPSELPHLNRSSRKHDDPRPWSDYYDHDICCLVRERYAADLETWYPEA